MADHQDSAGPPDWVRAPNLSVDPATYELENEALARDGRLDRALHELAPWSRRTLLDIGAGTGFWLPRYAATAARVIGVEPDPELLGLARQRCGAEGTIEIRRGSAERLPVDDRTPHRVPGRRRRRLRIGAPRCLAQLPLRPVRLAAVRLRSERTVLRGTGSDRSGRSG